MSTPSSPPSSPSSPSVTKQTIHKRNKKGQTALHIACEDIKKAQLDVISSLVEAGVDINAQDSNGDTAISRAFFRLRDDQNGLDVITYLLNVDGIDVNVVGGGGCTAVHYACMKIPLLSVEIVKQLFEKNNADINLLNDYNFHPFNYVITHFDQSRHDINILMYLFQKVQIDDNKKSSQCSQFLIDACLRINTVPYDFFKHLVEEYSADVNIPNENNGCTGLHLALTNFNKVINAQHINGLTPLDTLNYLIGIYDDTNAPPSKSLMYCACLNIRNLPLEVYKKLIIEKKCDINEKDVCGVSPIRRAVMKFARDSDSNTLLYLLEQSTIDWDELWNGTFLFHDACKNINTIPIEIFKYMIEKTNCNIYIKNDTKQTPLCILLETFDHSNKTSNPNKNAFVYLLSQYGIFIPCNNDNTSKIGNKDSLSSYCLGLRQSFPFPIQFNTYVIEHNLIQKTQHELNKYLFLLCSTDSNYIYPNIISSFCQNNPGIDMYSQVGRNGKTLLHVLAAKTFTDLVHNVENFDMMSLYVLERLLSRFCEELL
jgi:ankyrin repeat protein